MTLQEISSYIKGKEFKDFVVNSLLSIHRVYCVSRDYYGKRYSDKMLNEILQKNSHLSLKSLKRFTIAMEVTHFTHDLYDFEVFFNFNENTVEIRFYDKLGSDPDPYIIFSLPFEVFETFDVNKMRSYLEDYFREISKKTVKCYIQSCRESRQKRKKEEETLYQRYLRLKNYFEKKEKKNAQNYCTG